MKTAFTIVFSIINVACFAQTYEEEISKAGSSYEQNHFDSCAYYFKKAFQIKQGSGVNLYNAAVCNQLAGNRHKAFTLLKLAINKGANISKLKIDPELDPLHDDKQWNKLLKYASTKQVEEFKKTMYPQYAEILSILWEKDQYYRFRIGNAIKRGDTAETNALWKKMRAADSTNGTVSELLKIIDSIGWPTVTKVGKAGAGTAFLIIDHSSPSIMEKYLPALEEAAKKGEASMSNYATMKDRVLTNKGQKQIYGTQKYWNEKEKRFVYFPIQDESNVNQKRREVGLPPLPEFK